MIWDFIKKITNKNINNPINHLSQGNINATSEKHIANLIAENFAQVSSTKKTTQISSTRSESKKKRTIKFTSDNTESYNQAFTVIELENSISKSNNSASSSDEIYYILLKEHPTISLKYIWISGNIPTLWKQATTISILKKQNDRTNSTSYRLISLTSCPCKTLEG